MGPLGRQAEETSPERELMRAGLNVDELQTKQKYRRYAAAPAHIGIGSIRSGLSATPLGRVLEGRNWSGVTGNFVLACLVPLLSLWPQKYLCIFISAVAATQRDFVC